MSLRNRAKAAAKSIDSLLGEDARRKHTEEFTRIIEAAMIDAYKDCTERNSHVAAACCAEDQDRAHKIAEEMRRANTALIANLSSLR